MDTPARLPAALPDGLPAAPNGATEFFGAAYPIVERFGELLATEGTIRGLIGPREVPNLWERHLLNSAAVVQYLPTRGRLVDLGSGGGLPGIVVAAMRPDQPVTLIEPMLRRTNWLSEVVTALELTNVTVERGRAEDLSGKITATAITARAVAPLAKLLAWSRPLLAPRGELIALKGANVATEIPGDSELQRAGWSAPQIHQAHILPGIAPTTVVQVCRR